MRHHLDTGNQSGSSGRAVMTSFPTLAKIIKTQLNKLMCIFIKSYIIITYKNKSSLGVVLLPVNSCGLSVFLMGTKEMAQRQKH